MDDLLNCRYLQKFTRYQSCGNVRKEKVVHLVNSNADTLAERAEGQFRSQILHLLQIFINKWIKTISLHFYQHDQFSFSVYKIRLG